MSFLLAVTFGGLVAVAVTVVLIFTVATNLKNTISLLDENATTTIQALKVGFRGHLDPSRQAVERVARLYEENHFDLEKVSGIG